MKKLSGIHKDFQTLNRWKAINFLSKIDKWKTFEKNYWTIAPNILYIKEKEICPAYISKITSNCKKLLMKK